MKYQIHQIQFLTGVKKGNTSVSPNANLASATAFN